MSISKKILKNLACPKCKSKIGLSSHVYSCENLLCGAEYSNFNK